MIGNLLSSAGSHGRLILIGGLVIGILLPPFALFMKEFLAPLIAFLLFLNAFRIGPKAALGSLASARNASLAVLVFQLVLPCAAVLLFGMLEVSGAIPLALVIMLSASSISGSPNLTQLLGHDPAATLRLLILGTALLPLTVLPVFALSPDLGSVDVVVGTALRLLAIIAISSSIAFALRGWFFKELDADQTAKVDGLSVIVMGVVVIGLMSALGPALIEQPLNVAITMAIAFAANFTLQAGSYFLLSKASSKSEQVGFSVVAGNRNMALFLTALPAATTEPILLYIACYQLPMYLTPILMRRIYNR